MATDLSPVVATLAQRIQQATAPIDITGGGTQRGYCEAEPHGTTLSTAALAGIIAYEPTELYIRVGAGTPVAQLRATLAAEGQELAADVPGQLGATIGGALACALDGPQQPSKGRMRDHLLGCQLINGNGAVLNFGGTVLKNVAGFDASRLQVGALGTLGLLTQLSLRVGGQAPVTATIQRECSAHDANLLTNEAVARGLPLAASAWHKDVLHLRLNGSNMAVSRARNELGGHEMSTCPDKFWTALRDRQLGQLGTARTVWLCQVPPLAELPFDDHGLIEWHGMRRWFFDFDNAPENLRETVAAAGGSAVLYRSGPGLESVPTFPPQTRSMRLLHKRIKAVFDPRGILNPGRLGYF